MAKTDWTSIDTVRPEDMNDIGEEINDLESSVTVWLGVTEGTGTKYTVTSSKVSSLFESLRVSFRVHQTSGADPTLQINGLGAVPLKKPNGRAAKLDADGVYTAVYSAASFILQGEGGEYGTAGASQVRAPYTIGTENGIVTGTMPTITKQGVSGTWENPMSGTTVNAKVYGVLPDGYYNQATELNVSIEEPNLVSQNIVSGKTIFDVPGDPYVVNTGDANLIPDDGTQSQLLCYPYTAYSKGVKVWGVAEDFRGDLIPVTADNPNAGTRFTVSPPQGGFVDHKTKFEVFSPNLQPKNIRKGLTLLGVSGAMGAVKNVTRGQGIIGAGGLTLRINMSLDLNSVVLYFGASSIDTNPRSTKVKGKIDALGLYFELAVAATTHVVVRYELVEYDNVKQIIRGDTVRETGTAAHIVTLPSAVDFSRTLLIGSYNTDAPNDWEFGQVTPWIIPYLATNNQITLWGSSVIKPSTITKEWWAYQVVEFL